MNNTRVIYVICKYLIWGLLMFSFYGVYVWRLRNCSRKRRRKNCCSELNYCIINTLLVASNLGFVGTLVLSVSGICLGCVWKAITLPLADLLHIPLQNVGGKGLDVQLDWYAKTHLLAELRKKKNVRTTSGRAIFSI